MVELFLYILGLWGGERCTYGVSSLCVTSLGLKRIYVSFQNCQNGPVSLGLRDLGKTGRVFFYYYGLGLPFLFSTADEVLAQG